MRRLLAATLVAMALLATPPLITGTDGPAARAQTAPAAGTIEGNVVSGTACVSSDAIDGLIVQLIALGEGAAPTSQSAALSNGRFRFSVPADPTVTYIAWLAFEGVQYFAPPLLLSPELPAIEAEIIVYGATSEPPPLSIVSTTVTVLALSRTESRLELERTDIVSNPSDRTYVGTGDGVTLRLPVPDGLIDAGGLPASRSSFTRDGGTLAGTVPLLPGEVAVSTRYVVGYDRAEDAYRLRITAPLPTRSIVIRVPERFVQELRPAGATRRGESVIVEGERMLVVELTADKSLRPGLSALADLRGLAGRRPEHPLTQARGAATGVALALLTIGLVVLLRQRLVAARSR